MTKIINTQRKTRLE